MAKTPLFRGSCTAIITPFTKTGVDYEQLERNIEFQYENGTAAVVGLAARPAKTRRSPAVSTVMSSVG